MQNDKREIFEIGSSAPDFVLPSSDGSMVGLNDFVGKSLIIYFYPKDDTPGCTQQAKDFKNKISEFKKLDITIIGISKDTTKSHNNFKTRYQLPFILLSDTKTTTIQAYGAWVEKYMFGKKYLGIDRSTFFIDSDHKIKKIWRGVRVKGHIDAVLDFIKSKSL